MQGVKPTRVITREILPNLVSPLMVELGLRLTYSIVIIAGLSFLGFGQQPPAPSWGNMISENRIGLADKPLGRNRARRTHRPARDRHQPVR